MPRSDWDRYFYKISEVLVEAGLEVTNVVL